MWGRGIIWADGNKHEKKDSETGGERFERALWNNFRTSRDDLHTMWMSYEEDLKLK